MRLISLSELPRPALFYQKHRGGEDNIPDLDMTFGGLRAIKKRVFSRFQHTSFVPLRRLAPSPQNVAAHWARAHHSSYGDAHRAIYRKAADVRPGAHVDGVILVDQLTFAEAAQNTGSYARLDFREYRRVEVGGGMTADARRLIRGDGCIGYAVDDAAVEVDVLVQA